MSVKVLFLNCTLKKSPETSNTQAFIDIASGIYKSQGAVTETVRVVDEGVAFGNSNDEGVNDGWPKILEKIRSCDILVIATPIWRGDRSSVAKMVNERLDGIMKPTDGGNGQYPTYNKVGAVLVDGNEDGAKKALSSICFDLTEQGFTLPVNPYSYYVGVAGPGPSYIKAGGDKHYFTNNMLQLMVHNTMFMAKLLKDNPYPTNLHQLEEEAEKMSEEKK